MDELLPPLFDYVKVEPPVSLQDQITAVAVSERISVIGYSSGSIVVMNNSTGTKLMNDQHEWHILSKPVTSISVSAETFCYSSANTGEIVVVTECDAKTSITLPPVPSEYRPIHSLAISPNYASGTRRIALAGGACPDIVVLSQEGPPFPSIAVSKDGSSSRGSIDKIVWCDDNILVWSGSDMGIKILNTITGQKIAHFPLFGNISFSIQNNLIVVLNNLDILVAIIREESSSKLVCEIKSRIKLDSKNFFSSPVMALNKTTSHDWWESVLEKPNRDQVIAVGIFDPRDRFSIALTTISTDQQLVHSVVDTTDINHSMSDIIANNVNSKIVQVDIHNNYSVFAIGSYAIISRRRTIVDHCDWLIEHGYYEQAVKLVTTTRTNSSDEKLKSRVFNACIQQLVIDKKAFYLVSKLVLDSGENFPIPWSPLIEYFVSFSTGADLAESLRSLIKVVPHHPKYPVTLPSADYDTIIDALLRNHEYSSKDLLSIVRTWPETSYNIERLRDQLMDSLIDDNFTLDQGAKNAYLSKGIVGFPPNQVEQSVDDGHIVNQIALTLALKHLYDYYRDFAESLNILLRLRCIDELILLLQERVVESESVRHWFEINFEGMIQIEALQTVQFSIEHMNLFPARTILSRLENQPFLKHVYLRELFRHSPDATQSHQDKMIASFIDFDVSELRGFLESATHYDVQTAVSTVCNARKKLVRQKTDVFRHLIDCEALLLWQTKRPVEAIDLLLNVGGEIQSAVTFASRQANNDSSIWDAIFSKVRQNEPELLPSLLKTLLDLRSSTDLPHKAYPNVILRETLFPYNVPGLLTISHLVIDEEALRTRIIQESLTNVRSEWMNKRSNWGLKNRLSVTRIDPANATCSVCQMRLCAPSPGTGEDHDNLYLNTVSRIADNIPVCTRADSALFVVISGTEMVHSKCLVRTTTDFPRNLG